jgi:CheY-like chemotaxis protein
MSEAAIGNASAGGGILIVEDDQAAAEEMVELLKRQFPLVDICRTGQDGLLKLDSAPHIDLLILDVKLPDSTGLSLLQGIRKDYASRYWLQCVFITGQARRGYILDALRQGAVDFLIKPLDPQALLSSAIRGLDRARRIRRVISGQDLSRSTAGSDSDSSEELIGSYSDHNRTLRILKRYLAALRAFPGRQKGAVGDPDWIMLLDLLGAERAGRKTTITAMCAASGLPQATALRHIDSLVREGFVSRTRDPADRRRIIVTLEADVAAKIDEHLIALADVFDRAATANSINR